MYPIANQFLRVSHCRLIDWIAALKKEIAAFLFIHNYQVIIESNQLRREVDSAGPLSELKHRKKMSLRFNSIIKHIKGPECKAVVMVLHISHSKIMKVRKLKY